TGQTIRFPQSTPPAAALPPTLNSPPPISSSIAPGAAGAPINPYTGSAATAAPFDPYSASGSAAYQFWSTTPPSNAAGAFAQPSVSPYGATSPLAPQGSFPTYGPPPASTTAPPSYIFPNSTTPQLDLTQSIRFIQDVRLRDTYVGGGNDPNDLGINDTEVAITFTVPNFLTTG